MTTSMVMEVGTVELHAPGHSGPEQGGSNSYYCQSQNEIFEVWTCLNLTLAPGPLPPVSLDPDQSP